MSEPKRWREAVQVMRGLSLDAALRSAPTGRTTAFDFTAAGGSPAWIGAVSMQPGSVTGAHHHGATDVLIYVLRGRSEIRWGDRLEFGAEVGSGDLVYFSPEVPHQEQNLSWSDTVEFLVVRSNPLGIVEKVATSPVERPEIVA